MCYELRCPFLPLQRIEGRVAALQTAADAFYKAKNEFAAKVCPVLLQQPPLLPSRSSLLVPLIPVLPYPCPQATEDQMRLLRLQRRLEDELGGRFLDLSVHDTVTTLILSGQNKRAEQLARDFRIPDKR